MNLRPDRLATCEPSSTVTANETAVAADIMLVYDLVGLSNPLLTSCKQSICENGPSELHTFPAAGLLFPSASALADAVGTAFQLS